MRYRVQRAMLLSGRRVAVGDIVEGPVKRSLLSLGRLVPVEELADPSKLKTVAKERPEGGSLPPQPPAVPATPAPPAAKPVEPQPPPAAQAAEAQAVQAPAHQEPVEPRGEPPRVQAPATPPAAPQGKPGAKPGPSRGKRRPGR